MRRVERALQSGGATVRRGGAWDPWDLEVVCGALGAARLIVAVEDHGAGNQLVRSRWWPSVSIAGLTAAAGFAALAVAAELDGARPATAVLGAAALWLVLCIGCQCGAAAAVIGRTVQQRGDPQ